MLIYFISNINQQILDYDPREHNHKTKLVIRTSKNQFGPYGCAYGPTIDHMVSTWHNSIYKHQFD